MPRHIARVAKPIPYFMKYASEYYSKLKKFNKSQSNMNRLCFAIEKMVNEIRFKRKYKDFDYNIMIDNTIPFDEYKFKQLEELYLEFSKEISELGKQNSMLKNKDVYENYFSNLDKKIFEYTDINWEFYYEKYKKRANEIAEQKELANMAVELCYKRYKTKSKKFIWIISGQGVIDNIIQTKIELPIQDINGKYEYLGKKYNLKEVDNFVE